MELSPLAPVSDVAGRLARLRARASSRAFLAVAVAEAAAGGVVFGRVGAGDDVAGFELFFRRVVGHFPNRAAVLVGSHCGV